MDYNNLSWKKKILVQLDKAKDSGMTAHEVISALKADNQGEWKSPSIPTLLYHMDKDGLIRIDRARDRNIYHIIADVEQALSVKPGPVPKSSFDRKEVRLCMLFSQNEIESLGGEQAIQSRMERAARDTNY